jgi:hypothetical protein
MDTLYNRIDDEIDDDAIVSIFKEDATKALILETATKEKKNIYTIFSRLFDVTDDATKFAVLSRVWYGYVQLPDVLRQSLSSLARESTMSEISQIVWSAGKTFLSDGSLRIVAHITRFSLRLAQAPVV